MVALRGDHPAESLLIRWMRRARSLLNELLDDWVPGTEPETDNLFACPLVMVALRGDHPASSSRVRWARRARSLLNELVDDWVPGTEPENDT